MQHLGRAEAVENVDAVALAPAPADLGRQRFAGGDAAADLQLGSRRRRGARQKGGIERRHRIEDRDVVLLEELGDRVRRRPLRQQHGGGARRQRKSERVAEPVGEEQLRHRIADVVFADADHRRRIKRVGEFQIGMGMHRALRPAGRARRVEPEAHVVARRCRGSAFRNLGIGLGFGHQLVEREMRMRVLAGDDDMFEVVALPDRIGEFVVERFGDDQHPRPRIVEHEAVVGLGHQRVDRDRHDAGLDGAEERGRPIDGVEEADENALLAAAAERAQHLAEAFDPVGELGIGVLAAIDRYRRVCCRGRRRDCA